MPEKPSHEALKIKIQKPEEKIQQMGKPDSDSSISEKLSRAKQVEAALRQSEEKYRTMIERSNDMIWTLDTEGNFTFFNKQAQKVTGLEPGEWIGKSFVPLIMEEDLPMIKEVFQKSLQGESLNYELRFKNQTEENLTILVNTAPILKDGKIDGIVSFGRDITAIKKLEIQLRQAQKMEAIGTLAGGVAHDFNNILSGIMGYSQLAEMHINETEKAKHYIAQVVQGVQRASALVQQILAFRSQSDDKKHPLRVSALVKEALKLLRSSIPSTIEIKENIFSRAMVVADPIQVHQVIMNLCTNAYHAMGDAGGVLNVGLNEIEVSKQEASLALKGEAGKYLVLEVSDTGHGMDEKTLRKIFDPYFTTKKIGKGTGLGLAVVDGIVKNHNGFIKAQSEPGQGSTFQVFWPVSEGSSIAQEKKKIKLFRGTEKIMLVDDETDILDTLQAILEKQGYKIKTFKDGVSALEIFREDPYQFDLIITDMTMPRMTGEKLAVEVLKIRKNMPIILCTGFHERFNKDLAQRIGIRKYVQKPIMADDLSKMIHDVLTEKNTKNSW